MKYPTHISIDMIATMPQLSYPNRTIHIVESQEELIYAMEELNKHKVLGFDTETKPSFKKGIIHPVSLMQLATPESCFLIRLLTVGKAESLIQLLSNPAVIKVGISLRDDFNGLKKWNSYKPQGFFDIQQEIQQLGIEELSLQKIYAILFSKRISKNQRLSNWEAPILSEAQRQYAAIDAWACLDIYNLIKEEI